jgi:hypothetical protein
MREALDWHEALLKVEYSFQSEQPSRPFFTIFSQSLTSIQIHQTRLYWRKALATRLLLAVICFRKPSPVMTKCPKSQNCRPTYFSVVASVMIGLESVRDENFES